MATDTESMHENMTRLRMRMVQQKLANERERLQRPESEGSSNGYENQVKLQHAMLKRQELLDRIRQEQEDKRPRSYSPRRRYTPSLLAPPSRRSLPDITNRTYHLGLHNRGTPRINRDVFRSKRNKKSYRSKGNSNNYYHRRYRRAFIVTDIDGNPIIQEPGPGGEEIIWVNGTGAYYGDSLDVVPEIDGTEHMSYKPVLDRLTARPKSRRHNIPPFDEVYHRLPSRVYLRQQEPLEDPTLGYPGISRQSERDHAHTLYQPAYTELRDVRPRMVVGPPRTSPAYVTTVGPASDGGSANMSQVKHVIEHQFRQAPVQHSYSLPAIQHVPAVQPVPAIQPVPAMTAMPAMPAMPGYPMVGFEKKKDKMFKKSDFMDMMMLQNAQMHHMVMQQMMLHQLPGSRPHTYPQVAEPMVPLAAPYVRQAPSVYHHHIQNQPYSMPPMDYRGQGGNYGNYGRYIGRRRMPLGRKGIPTDTSAGVVERRSPVTRVIRTDNVRKTSKPYPFPGPKGMRRLRHIAYAAWFIACLRAMAKKKGGARPSSVFLFGIILKEIVAALHRIYLNPNGNMYPVMQDIIAPGAQDLSQLLYRPDQIPDDDPRGRRRPRRGDPHGPLIQILQYVIENLVYHMTEIMPKTGVLGTHKKSAVFEMIKTGKRFPDGYFWQIELDRLEFDSNGRIVNVGNLEAFILLVGIFLSRSFITTLLLKPVDYGLSNDPLSETAERNIKMLSTCLLFLVRRTSTRRESPMMAMPGEVARYVFADEEMRPVHLRLRRTYEYCENLLREWGAEYIKRLRQAATVTTNTTTNKA